MTTKAEKAHLAKVAEIGCIVCLKAGLNSPAEVHHIRQGQGRKKASHKLTIPLCPAHHRQADGTAKYQGEIGYHVSPCEFTQRYGTERELLGEVMEMLNLFEYGI